MAKKKHNMIRKMIRESLRHLMEEEGDASKPPKPPEADTPTESEGPKAPETPSVPDAEKPSEQAKKLGLQYKGFGDYIDPKTGKVVAQTVQGKLVRKEPTPAEFANDKLTPKQPAFSDDDDPYSAKNLSAPRQLGGNRAQTHKLSAITGDKADDKKAVSRRDALGQAGRDAYSDGGIGSFAGSVKPATPEAGPEQTIAQVQQSWRDAQAMIKKYGDTGKAIEQLEKSRAALQSRVDLLMTHNTNTSGKRQAELDQQQKYINKIDTTIGLLKGESPAKPGSIEPPKNKRGEPWRVEVEHEGTPKLGYIDFMNNDTDEAHVSFDDGTYGMFRTNDLKSPGLRSKRAGGMLTKKQLKDFGRMGEESKPWDVLKMNENYAPKLKKLAERRGETLDELMERAFGVVREGDGYRALTFKEIMERDKLQLEKLTHWSCTKTGKDKIEESEGSEQAAELGLHYIGFGRYIDDSGMVVAKTIDGQLVRVEPEDIEASELDPKLEKQLMKVFKTNGEYTPQGDGTMPGVIRPGWNKTHEDIPYDANGEKTVQKLLGMVGDPAKLVRWLVKTFKKETPNGKQRILQYLGILKNMGVLDQEDQQQAQNPNAAPSPDRAQEQPAARTRATPELFA